MAVRFVAFNEDGWMPPNTDRRMWKGLCDAYGFNFRLIQEALAERWDDRPVPPEAPAAFAPG